MHVKRSRTEKVNVLAARFHKACQLELPQTSQRVRVDADAVNEGRGVVFELLHFGFWDENPPDEYKRADLSSSRSWTLHSCGKSSEFLSLANVTYLLLEPSASVCSIARVELGADVSVGGPNTTYTKKLTCFPNTTAVSSSHHCLHSSRRLSGHLPAAACG